MRRGPRRAIRLRLLVVHRGGSEEPATEPADAPNPQPPKPYQIPRTDFDAQRKKLRTERRGIEARQGLGPKLRTACWDRVDRLVISHRQQE